MYDYSTGAVCDGLNCDGMNGNQGAESVVCYLMALSSLNKYADKVYGTILQSRISEELSEVNSLKRKSLLSVNQVE
jgi:hypothetical protein